MTFTPRCKAFTLAAGLLLSCNKSPPVNGAQGLSTPGIMATPKGQPCNDAHLDGDRPLVVGEAGMALLFFDGALDTSTVAINGRPYYHQNPQYIATAHESSMRVCFYSAARHSPDYSNGPDEMKPYFLHEMVHIWQYQNGKWRGAHGADYAYSLRGKKSFDTFGSEQQGALVEEYTGRFLTDVKQPYKWLEKKDKLTETEADSLLMRCVEDKFPGARRLREAQEEKIRSISCLSPAAACTLKDFYAL
jgi:hypothetical protein